MDKELRITQLEVLKVFAKHSKTFALAGGTALELYYLHHRFSRDLDFFSPTYDTSEIEKLIGVIGRELHKSVRLENTFVAPSHAQVRFYTLPSPGPAARLKLDFVEDVLFKKPTIQKMNGVPVYAPQHIYLQKIMAIAGTRKETNVLGRETASGRGESRDVLDIYYLSKNVAPLHQFLADVPPQQQRGMVQWYRSYSRQQFKLDLLELNLYDQNLDGSSIIAYLDSEISRYIKGALK